MTTTCDPVDVDTALASKTGTLEDGTPLPPITWLTTPEAIEKCSDEVVSATIANLDAIAAIPLDSVTFDNVIKPLMCPPNYKTNANVAACKFLQHCSTDDAVRKAAQAAGNKFTETRVAGRMRKDVYDRVVAFNATPEAGSLDSYFQHFCGAIQKDFERAGLALSPEDASTLKALLKEDSDACSQFGANLGADSTTLKFSRADLRGLPEAFVDQRSNRKDQPDVADVDEVITVTLKYPDIIPIGSNCEVSSTRKAVTDARDGAAFANNLDLVALGINLRKRIANLLGFPSWAHFVTTQRMSGSPEAVDSFLADLEGKLREPAEVERGKLLALKAAHLAETGQADASEAGSGDLNPWDLGFYNNMLLKREYGVDDEAVKLYFPLAHVVETTLAIYQELLGLTFVELPAGSFWRWHPSVRCFAVRDTESADWVGHFYLDMHPREGKYTHAAIFHLVKRSDEHGCVDCMLCNLPAPSADGKPALLRHDDVVTFFHEFGHIMHGLCSEGLANSTRLAKCPRDFVEAPSQMLENWCWQSEVLGRLSKHHETGDPLPAELLGQLIRAKHVNVALFTLRQVYLSRLDLSIHGPEPPADAAGLQALVDELRPRVSLMANPPGHNMLRSFGHLMNQYSASYYGYLWAEVISADMFATRFEAEGILNPKTGMDYRKMVLAPGGVDNIMGHLTRFLGRPPNSDAFLRSRGISVD